MKVTGLVAFVAALGASSALAAPAPAPVADVEGELAARANLPGLNAKQSAHARAIIAETKKEKLGHQGCLAAITTGLTEVRTHILSLCPIPSPCLPISVPKPSRQRC